MKTTNHNNNLTAIILVGGQSTRMGTDKSFLKFDNQDFISTVIGHAKKICNSLLIVSGKHNHSLFQEKNLTVISDERPGMGPMMGIITGLKKVKTEWVLVLSVDTPFFSTDMMQKLWKSKGNHQGVIFEDNEGIHPLNALYKTTTLKAWETAFSKGERKLTQVLKNIDIIYLLLTPKEALTMRNVNTKEDYNKINMNKSNSIIIMGSSRSDGETRKMVDTLVSHTDSKIIDLREKNISYFDYKHKNLGDDFFQTMEEILQYDTFIFATPVYWFSMSAIMKTFFDRFSDLLHQRKDLGYQMKGKNMYLLTNSSIALLTKHFETPFKDTAEYLSMEYKGYVHGYVKDGNLPEDVKDEIKKIAGRIKDGG